MAKKKKITKGTSLSYFITSKGISIMRKNSNEFGVVCLSSVVSESSGKKFPMIIGDEQWKPSRRYSHLAVSSLGRVLRLTSSGHWKLAIQYMPSSKRPYVNVHEGDKLNQAIVSVAILVTDEFLDKPKNYKSLTRNHINGVPFDNRAKNLEFCTKKENHEHAVKHGLSIKGTRNSSIEGLTEKDYECLKIAAELFLLQLIHIKSILIPFGISKEVFFEHFVGGVTHE